jgi:CTP synthase (UTP-ammonia lyase)
VRVGVELAGHRFFAATAYMPQLSSRPGAPHALVLAFLTAASGRAAARAAP